MRFFLHILVILHLTVAVSMAQPANDDCDQPFVLQDVNDFCSNTGSFTNVGATPSTYSPPSCFNSASHEVWFSFVATALDVTVTIVGDAVAGNSLQAPQVALYDNNCGSTLTQIACASSNNSIVELYYGGLIIGETYLLRVDGGNDSEGTFQFCINNYFPTVEPGGDCISAAVLCDKSSFVIQSVTGAGDDNNEAANSCLDLGGSSESNSTWFAWTAATSGSLTFILDPLNPTDDLDFAVYELPGGVNTCGNKILELCMASGAGVNEFPTPCHGPTGLSTSSTDISEAADCDVGDDNFVRPLNMIAGSSYALLVNNYSNTGNGFSIEFGGTGEFLGPTADFDVSDDPICLGDPVTFTDSSTPSNQIASWEWNFGEAGLAATGQGPHNILYTTTGVKTISLTIESNDGCLVSYSRQVLVQTCCTPLSIDILQNDLTCPDDNDGFFDLETTGDYPPFNFNWSNGETTEDILNLIQGNYFVTISDDRFCDTILALTINAPAPWLLNAAITKPTCAGGMDGAVSLNVSGATPPYEYDWGSGFTSNNTIANLPVSDQDVTVRDAEGCLYMETILVRELELLLDPGVQTVQMPSCAGDTDGSITIVISNGQAPYQYDFNDGNGFTSNNSLNGIPAGDYNVDVMDANGCLGQFYPITVNEPFPLGLNIATDSVQCFGEANGAVSVMVSGGTLPYSYAWDTPFDQQNNQVSNLPAASYQVTVTDLNGCIMTGATTVHEPPAVIISNIEVIDNECFGDSNGQIDVTAFGGNPPYTFSTDGINFQTSNSLAGLSSGNYTITVRDVFGCEFTDQASISQPFEIIVDARSAQTIDLGFTADLQAVVNTADQHSYAWTPSESLDCGDCASPTAFPFATTTYHVLVTTEKGCIATDSVTIAVNQVRPIFIPNAFTPNFDGLNDVFLVYGGPAVANINRLAVYGRWGSLVHLSENHPPNDASFGWDGTLKGKLLNSGVFVYVVEIALLDGTLLEYSGSLTLLR